MEKDKIINGLTQQSKQSLMQFQLIQAQQSEKDSAVNELKDVIQDKDQVIGDLHLQMGKLMERLSDAEQKLFEL